MQKGIKIYLMILMLGSALNSYAQQGIQFSQYAFTGLTINPAYAGYKEDWTLNAVSRLQWTGINGAPRTGAISFDGVTNDIRKNVGIGFVAIADQLGPQTTASFYANYAYRLRLNSEDSQRLSLGVGIGASQYSIDASKFNPTDLNDGSINIDYANKITPDGRLGIFYTSPDLYIGISAVNLLADVNNNNGQNVYRQARSFYLSAGYMLPLNESISFKPSTLIKEDFKGPTNVDISANFLFGKTLWLGATYRTGVKTFSKTALSSNLSDLDAASAMAQFYVTERFRIGYSFDYNMSKLATAQNGTHELGIGISFGRRREKVLSPRYF